MARYLTGSVYVTFSDELVRELPETTRRLVCHDVAKRFMGLFTDTQDEEAPTRSQMGTEKPTLEATATLSDAVNFGSNQNVMKVELPVNLDAVEVDDRNYEAQLIADAVLVADRFMAKQYG